jgi:ribosome-binding factor A
VDLSGPRADRVADSVHRALARLLQQRVRDPRVGFVTLTDVKLSSDLRHAVAYFTVIDSERKEESLAGLKRATSFLRRGLAREAGLRFTPELRFVYDEVASSGQRVESLLEQVRQERDDDEADPTDD